MNKRYIKVMGQFMNLTRSWAFSVLILCIGFSVSFGADIPESMARNAGEHFAVSAASHMTGKTKVAGNCYKCRHILPIIEDNQVVGYFAEMEPEGVAVISGFSEMGPVVAWAPDMEFDSARCKEAFHDIIDALLQVKNGLNHEATAERMRRKLGSSESEGTWKESENKDTKPIYQTVTVLHVDPMVKTYWNQSFPFNALLPQVCSCQSILRVNAGCGAVAMAQVMKFWKYPDKFPKAYSGGYDWIYDNIDDPEVLQNCSGLIHNGKITKHLYYDIPYKGYDFGHYNYDWEKMTPYYDISETTTPFSGLPEDQRAVALLFHDICYSLKPQFGYGKDDTSAGFPASVVSAMWSFGYDWCSYQELQSYLSRCTTDAEFELARTEWYWMLSKQVLRGYPVMLSLHNETGNANHLAVIDGIWFQAQTLQESASRWISLKFGWEGALGELDYSGYTIWYPSNSLWALNFVRAHIDDSNYDDETKTAALLDIWPEKRAGNMAYLSICTEPFKDDVLPTITVDGCTITTEQNGVIREAKGAVEVPVAPYSTHTIEFEYLRNYHKRLTTSSRTINNVRAGSAGTTTRVPFSYVDETRMAHFATLTSSTDHGTISQTGDQMVIEGNIVQVTAFPDPGYQLSKWLVNDENYGSENPLEITVSGDMTVSAKFSKVPSFTVENPEFETDNLKRMSVLQFKSPTEVLKQVNCVARTGDMLYVAYGYLLSVLDVSQPENPQELAVFPEFFNYRSHAQTMLVRGNILYVMESSDVHLFDISDPLNPTLMSNWRGRNDGGWDMCFSDTNPDLLLVTIDQYGTYVVNVHDPSHPVTAGRLHPDEYPDLNTKRGKTARAVAVKDGIAYVTVDGIGLWLYDLSKTVGTDDNGVTCFQRLNTSTISFPGVSDDIDIIDNRAYVINSEQGLIVLNVSDARNPVRLNNFSMSPSPVKHQLVGNLSFVTTSGAGLELVDSFDPYNMTVVDADPLPGDCREVGLFGDLLAVTSETDGKLYLYQTKNPARQNDANLIVDVGDSHSWNDWGLTPEYWIVNKASQTNRVRVYGISSEGRIMWSKMQTLPPKGKQILTIHNSINLFVAQVRMEPERSLVTYAVAKSPHTRTTAYLNQKSNSSGVFAAHIPTSIDYWDTYAIASRDHMAGSGQCTVTINGTTTTPNVPSAAAGMNLESMMPAATPDGSAYAKINRMACGFEMFVKRNSDGAAVELFSGGSTTLYVPHIPEERDQFWTGLALLRPYSTDVTATLKFYSATGQLVYTATVDVPGKTKMVNLIDSMFPGLPTDASWCKITAPSSIMGIDVYGTYSEGICGFSLPTKALTTSILPDIRPSAGSDWTGISITNPNNQSVSVKVELVRSDGNVATSKTVSVGALCKYKAVLTDFFDSAPLYETDYLRVSANPGVLAVEVSGSHNNSWMTSICACSAY